MFGVLMSSSVSGWTYSWKPVFTPTGWSTFWFVSFLFMENQTWANFICLHPDDFCFHLFSFARWYWATNKPRFGNKYFILNLAAQYSPQSESCLCFRATWWKSWCLWLERSMWQTWVEVSHLNNFILKPYFVSKHLSPQAGVYTLASFRKLLT